MDVFQTQDTAAHIATTVKENSSDTSQIVPSDFHGKIPFARKRK